MSEHDLPRLCKLIDIIIQYDFYENICETNQRGGMGLVISGSIRPGISLNAGSWDLPKG